MINQEHYCHYHYRLLYPHFANSRIGVGRGGGGGRGRGFGSSLVVGWRWWKEL